MGKRARKRARDRATPGPKPSGRSWSNGQQMARVNVSPEAWSEFRIEALRTKRSVADYLGHLVTREVGRINRRDDRRHDRDQSLASEPPTWEI